VSAISADIGHGVGLESVTTLMPILAHGVAAAAVMGEPIGQGRRSRQAPFSVGHDQRAGLAIERAPDVRRIGDQGARPGRAR
jgi:hypothetical protein